MIFLKISKILSLYDWCIENNKQDILDRWDYKLNDCSPKNIIYNSKQKRWLKCPLKIHKSELQDISNFVYENTKALNCKACNSFAQWGINNLGTDFLKKYWNYEKNIGVDPWVISKSSGTKVWIKCQEKDYHGSYKVRCSDFINKNSRCPYCKHFKIHLLDSLGALYPESLKYWSDKNKKSPYEYSPHSAKGVYWKCPDGKHKDYKRCIHDSVKLNFHCRKCNFSKGEKQIEDWLINNNIKFESQKEFEGLIGMGYGLLSYDFYLPIQNILIEYQGEFHDGTVPYQSEIQFDYQQEHDRRKKQYAIDNNIKLLEIWYWDFDNIEEILDKELKGE